LTEKFKNRLSEYLCLDSHIIITNNFAKVIFN